MNILNKLIAGFLILCSGCAAMAQTVKQIEVAGDEPYVDHVALVPGSTDMDLLVKIAFNEPENSLTVSLISYRRLFVFQSDVRYSHVVRWHKLKPEKLPYVVESDELARYKLSKPLRKSFSSPRRKHVFKRWIDYEGLQPQPAEYRMVNDYIEQTFDILYKEAPVSVTLGDLLVMSEELTPKKKKYDLFFQVSMDRKYEITIRRDPCFGREEALQAAAARTEGVRAGFRSFEQKFADESSMNTPAGAKIFNEVKELLVAQFPRVDETSPCPDIQQNIDLYNSYVDSIRNMQSRYVMEVEAKADVLGLSADAILNLARKIDNHVNRWLLTSDPAEKKDLAAACREIIGSVRSHLGGSPEISGSQAAALAVFYRAEAYFRKTCVKE